MGEFDHIVAAMHASPIMRQLIEMGLAGDHSRLDTNQARRQHFIPQFVLREFAAPRGGGHMIFQMPIEGWLAPKAISVRDAAVRKDLYVAVDEDGQATNRHEGYLALIEHHAAPAIRRFLDDPAGLGPGDRATIAFFVAFQMMRTPAAAELITQTANVAFRAAAANVFGDAKAFAARQRRRGDERTDEELEQFRREVMDQVREGKVTVVGDDGAHFSAGFEQAAGYVPQLIAFDWLLVRAPAGGIIASDRGYAIYDPAPLFPWSAQGLLSSDRSETFVPLADTAGLLLRPGTASCRLEVREASSHEVEGLNLRTLGWAASYVYAKTQATLDSVRTSARERPADVIRPKAPPSVIGIEIDPDDTSLVDANRARGWPERIVGNDGRPRDYVVIPNDGPRAEEHRRVDEIGERRLRKRLGVGQDEPLDGHFTTEPLHPLDLRPWQG